MMPRLVVCKIRAQPRDASGIRAGHGIAGEGLYNRPLVTSTSMLRKASSARIATCSTAQRMPSISAVRVHVEVTVRDRLAATVIGSQACPPGGSGRLHGRSPPHGGDSHVNIGVGW